MIILSTISCLHIYDEAVHIQLFVIHAQDGILGERCQRFFPVTGMDYSRTGLKKLSLPDPTFIIVNGLSGYPPHPSLPLI